MPNSNMLPESMPPSTPEAILDLATGYQRSKTLFALLELEVFSVLSDRTISLKEAAAQLSLHPIATDRLLNAGVALGLLRRNGNDFQNTPESEEFLVKDRASYIGEQILKYDQTSYPRWNNLVERLKRWQPGQEQRPASPVNAESEAAILAGHNLALLTGRALGQAYDFTGHKMLLDLGGGTGGMSIGICSVHSVLSAIVFDQPGPADVARRCIAENGLADRIAVVSGDFKTDALPKGFDIILMANLLSVASEETNRELLKRIYQELPTGGVCILSGWILDDSRTAPQIPVLFCLEDISWDAPDVERTASTYESWLGEAGFTVLHRKQYYSPTSMIVARKD